MTNKDVIRNTIEMCNMVLTTYISDLTDDELMVRSVPETNHIAWQLGHVISSERQLMTGAGHPMPELPEGFVESYTKETTTSDDPAKFHKKDQYLAWMAQQRSATLAALASLPESDLDKPGPESMREFVPTIGALFNLLGMHMMMHAGQFVPVRRKLGKPVLI